MRLSLRWSLLLLLVLLAGSAAHAAKPSGKLRLITFEEGTGKPLKGAVIEIGGKKATTSSYGAVRLTVPAGKHKLVVTHSDYAAGETVDVPIAAGGVTEVVVTLFRIAAPRFQVEARADTSGAATGNNGTGPAKPVELAALTGKVLSSERKKPISGARIFIRGVDVEGLTDAKGRFTLQLPKDRKHDLTFVHPSFSTMTKRDIAVPGTLNVELTPAAVEVDDLVVSAPRIVGSALDAMDKRRKKVSVAEVIGAEQMSRQGDSNAASALKRATGVTIVGGRFVYVRGLGERYSSTLLNGSGLPSPDPERRVVPLDMFPAGLLKSVTIEKSYSVDKPGEFGGGTVLIDTRAFPKEFELSLSLSTSMRLGTTFEQGLAVDGGPTDWLGIDGGFRSLPANVQKASDSQPILPGDLFSDSGYTNDELEAFGESMPTNITPHRRLVPPGIGLSVTYGDSFQLRENDEDYRFGYLMSLVYDSEWERLQFDRNIYTVGQGGKLELAHPYSFEQLQQEITTAAFLNLGLDWGPNYQFRLTSFLNRISTDESRDYSGENRDVATRIRVVRARWVERMLSSNQLKAAIKVPELNMNIDARYALSVATRLEPDRRQVRYDLEPSLGTYFLSDRPEGNQRVFSDLLDFAHDVGVDVSAPVHQDGPLKLEMKGGVALLVKDRTVDTRRLKYMHKGPLSTDDAVLQLTPEEIFSPKYISREGFVLNEVTLPTDNYTADQIIFGAYAQLTLNWGEMFTLVAGVRLEHSEQTVTTFEPFNPNPVLVPAELDSTDVLPSVSAVYRFEEDMALRFNVARTVSRPDFRELSPATFNDVTGGRQLFGNPDLDRALLTHVDLRWDWNPSQGELLSVGAFFKHFDKPIETIIVPSAQLSVTYANAPEAYNTGIELEFTKDFGFLHEALEDLYLSGNAAWIFSNVNLEGLGSIQTSKERPLQGQAPFVVNLQLGYQNADSGTGVSLLYNVSGRRIVEAGAQDAPDSYTEPVHQLDFVFRQTLGDGWKLNFKAKNLLDMPVVTSQGDEVVTSILLGRSFSLGLGKSF